MARPPTTHKLWTEPIGGTVASATMVYDDVSTAGYVAAPVRLEQQPPSGCRSSRQPVSGEPSVPRLFHFAAGNGPIRHRVWLTPVTGDCSPSDDSAFDSSSPNVIWSRVADGQERDRGTPSGTRTVVMQPRVPPLSGPSGSLTDGQYLAYGAYLGTFGSGHYITTVVDLGSMRSSQPCRATRRCSAQRRPSRRVALVRRGCVLPALTELRQPRQVVRGSADRSAFRRKLGSKPPLCRIGGDVGAARGAAARSPFYVTRDDDRRTRPHRCARTGGGAARPRCSNAASTAAWNVSGCDLEAIERQLLGTLALCRRRGGYRQVERQVGQTSPACGGVQAEQILSG